jgi:hypothetical protein
MCYSAQIVADYRKFVRAFGARLSLREFAELYFERANGSKSKIPKAMDAAFADPQTEEQREIKAAVDRFNAEQATALEQELFRQRTRLADAERTLQTKTTKAATESKRIATDKIDATIRRLEDLRRTELEDRDSRIFPGTYAPVMVMENGQRVIKPMRYQCRPAGKPKFYDSKFPGTYNARRDNLEGFWRDLFGYSHGLMVVNAFFENVSRARMEGRELQDGEKDENPVLEFRPNTAEKCWSPACGPAGRRQASRTSFRLRQSRTSLPRRSRRPATIAVSSRSSQRTSTRGCHPIRRIRGRSTLSSMIAPTLITSTDWRHSRLRSARGRRMGPRRAELGPEPSVTIGLRSAAFARKAAFRDGNATETRKL